MAVLRIVPNIPCDQTERASAFYHGLLGLDMVMDMGWVATYASDHRTFPQVSFAVTGGPETDVPDISIEVDDVDRLHERARQAGFEIVYGIVTEPWGVRRFHVRDPFGKIVNILAHCETGEN